MNAWKVIAALLLLGLFMVDRLVGDRPSDKYQATVDYPATSPSGKFRLVVVEGFDGEMQFAQFEIVTNEKFPRLLFCSEGRFRTRDTTFFLWDSDDRVWVYSGDVGTSYWERVQDSEWKRYGYGHGEPRRAGAPEFLKRVRPRAHQY